MNEANNISSSDRPNEVQIPASKELLRLCDLIDDLIWTYLPNPKSGKIIARYEAPAEAHAMMHVMIRHAESVTVLAKEDCVLLPSAMAIARTLFEASVTLRWMLRPTDPFEREARWVAHLRTGEAQWRKFANRGDAPKGLRDFAGQRESGMREHAEGVGAKLAEKGIDVPKKMPNLWERLGDLDEKELYNFYIWMSASSHMNFEGVSYVRRGFGDNKERGEFVGLSDWEEPLHVVWKSLFTAALDSLTVVEGDMKAFSAVEQLARFEIALEEFRESVKKK